MSEQEAKITGSCTVSGMRPTGPLHIGHYFGALKNFVEMQEDNKAFFFVADWHALTSDYADTSRVNEFVDEMVTDWLSVGLDPNKCIIFRQSQIKQHAELHLLLSMITPNSWLAGNYDERPRKLWIFRLSCAYGI